MAAVAAFCGVVAFRKTRLVRSSSEYSLYVLLAGCVLASIRTLLSGIASTTAGDVICKGRFFTGHLAYVVLVVPLTLRMWRLQYLGTYKGLKRSNVTAALMLYVTFGVSAVVVVYLIVAVFVGQPRVSYLLSTVLNQRTVTPLCTHTHVEFETTLFAVETAFVLYANRVRVWVRGRPGACVCVRVCSFVCL